MAKVHEIGIGADTRAFEDQVKRGVIKPTEEAEKALKKLGDTDAGADASRDLDKLEDALKDAQRQAKRTEDAIDDVGTGGKRGFGKMSEGAQEVTQEIGSNLGEAVSSVRDNFSDLGQVGQDTLGGLAATLAGTGPAGIAGAALLAAGAVGLGAMTAELQKQQEEAERTRERISDAYQQIAEDGQRFITTQSMVAEASDLMFNTDRADEWKQVQDDARTLQLDLQTVIKANSGDLEAQAAVQGQINGLLQDANSYELTGTTNKKTLKNDVADLRDRWQELNDVTQTNAEKSEQLRTITSDMFLGLIQSAGTAKEEVDDMGNKLLTFQTEHGEQKVVIDALTGEATANLEKFRGDADGVIRDVNSKEVVLDARTTIEQAQRDLDGFFIRNNGREIKIKGKIVTSGDQPWL